MGVASAVWYGLITYAGFTLGSDWETVLAKLREYGTIASIVAAVVLGVGVLAWWMRSRKRRA
jgi:membrane protein DedA with SNARE-associated domain